MEYLKELNKFLISVNDLAYTGNIALIHKALPDIQMQLSKCKPRYLYSAFQTRNFEGRTLFVDFLKRSQESMVKEIRISTEEGALRLHNEEYVQNKLIMVKAFGMNIDILPRKKTSFTALPDQVLVIRSFRLHRYGIEPFTPSFLTQELRNKLDEHNARFRKPNSNFTLSVVKSIF